MKTCVDCVFQAQQVAWRSIYSVVLKSYHVMLQVDFLLSRLKVLYERIDDTEDLINIELDHRYQSCQHTAACHVENMCTMQLTKLTGPVVKDADPRKCTL